GASTSSVQGSSLLDPVGAVDRAHDPAIGECAGLGEGDNTTAEAATGHACAVHTGLVDQLVDSSIHHWRRRLVEITKAVVAGNHQRPSGTEVAVAQDGREVADPLVLADHVLSAGPDDRI